jgi:hypothetical protein
MGHMIPSLAAFSVFFATLFFAPLLAAQNNWFQPGIVKEPAVAKALQSSTTAPPPLLTNGSVWSKFPHHRERSRPAPNTSALVPVSLPLFEI